MERRFLLAFVLSFFVLFVWSALFPPPKPLQKNTESMQVPHNRYDTSDKSLVSSLSDSPPVQPPNALVKPSGKISTIETQKLLIGFSSLGGSIERVSLKEFNTQLPIKNLAGLSAYDNLPFILESLENNKIIYVYENESVKIKKEYIVSNNDYLINVDVYINDINNMSKLNGIISNAIIINTSNLNAEHDLNYQRDRSLHEYLIFSDKGEIRKNNAYQFSSKESKTEDGKVEFIAFRDRYYCAIVKPLYDTSNYSIESSAKDQLEIRLKTKEGITKLSSIIYAGPEEQIVLKKYGLGFEKIKRFYKLWIFDIAAKTIYNLLHIIHKVLPNWGLCIIVISLIIYGSMYPLTLKGMTSMKKMQSMQPKIAALKEKYKNNPQKINQEMMELYKEHKINPLGGCLPFFLQSPVFIGLYQVLWRSVEFRGAKFLWIKDLSLPDRLFVFKFSLPVIGNEFNILPIIMCVIMFFQQKFTNKNMVIVDSAQAQQQKMMTRIFPIFFAFIFYKFASGLSLYFTMFYLLSTITQWHLTQKNKVAQ